MIEENQLKLGEKEKQEIAKHNIEFDKGDAYEQFDMTYGRNMHSNYYRDLVLVQYNATAKDMYQKGKAKVFHKYLHALNEHDFLRLMNKSQNDESWKRVDFIQTCLKTRIGYGRRITINFFAKMNDKKLEHALNYNYKRYGRDLYLLYNDQKAYCKKQILKMGFYISKVYHIEILQMKCEFLVDDEGIIWLHNVTNIITRTAFFKPRPKMVGFMQYTQSSETLKTASLDPNKPIYDFIPDHSLKTEKLIENKNSLAHRMFEDFKDIKHECGIMDVIEEVENHDETNEALKELYPDGDFTFEDITADNAKDVNSDIGKYILNRNNSSVLPAPSRGIVPSNSKSFNINSIMNIAADLQRNNSMSVVRNRQNGKKIQNFIF